MLLKKTGSLTTLTKLLTQNVENIYINQSEIRIPQCAMVLAHLRVNEESVEDNQTPFVPRFKS